jgi:acetyl esterase/lipase
VTEKGPAFFLFHGGGFLLGDFPTHERFVRDLVFDCEFTSIFVNYSRSPEAQYPTAINEAYAATKWVAEHGDEINVDGKRLAVVGNSAGATMATVTALKCKLEGGPALKAQVLFCPWTDANLERSSYNELSQPGPDRSYSPAPSRRGIEKTPLLKPTSVPKQRCQMGAPDQMIGGSLNCHV